MAQSSGTRSRVRSLSALRLEPPAFPTPENETGDAYDDAGNNASSDRRNIHDAPPSAQTRRQWARGDILTSSFGLPDDAAKTGIGQRNRHPAKAGTACAGMTPNRWQLSVMLALMRESGDPRYVFERPVFWADMDSRLRGNDAAALNAPV
jgi:hypothetical protein